MGALALGCHTAVAATTQAPVPMRAERMVLHPTLTGVYEVSLYKSGVIRLDQSAKRVSVGNPGIADILILRNRELYVVGKALGTTNIAVWDSASRVFASFNVEVTHDLETLKIRLHQLFPDEGIKVHSAQERIILSGQTSNMVKMNAAVELAQSFLPNCVKSESNITIADSTKGAPVVVQQGGGRVGNQECKEGRVVNIMEVGGAHQVMLEVKVAEMSRDVVRRLDPQVSILGLGGKFAGGGVNGGASFPPATDPAGLISPVLGMLGPKELNPIGPPQQLFSPNTATISDNGAFFSVLSGDFFMSAIFDITKENGLSRILAEPTLTTLSGQQAEFLSGGEFPIPVPQDFGQTTIEFKEFGVGLKFLPVVLDSNRISLKLNVSVSELTDANNVVVSVPGASSVFVVPALTKRSAQSTVELADGQTIGIAGLINENTRALYDKLPGAGDIPVLGALFRSQDFRSGRSELVIFVTPHLARPITPERIRLPTDSFVPPSDLEFYLMGRMEAARDPDEGDEPRHGGAEVTGALHGGHYGHSM
jgi:pilus assembly protein CpaC